MGLIDFERKYPEQEASQNGGLFQNSGPELTAEQNPAPVTGPVAVPVAIPAASPAAEPVAAVAAAGPVPAPSTAPTPAQPGHGFGGVPLPASAPARGREISQTAIAGRSLQPKPEDAPSGGGHTLDLLKQGLPLVQKLLPLLDGNILATVGNLLAPRPQTHAKVDLGPIEGQLTEMQLLQHDLRSKVGEHNTSLKRVEDQLELVKEATDRNTMEQQELMEDVRSMRGRVIVFSILILILLAASIVLNVLLYLHIKQVLP